MEVYQHRIVGARIVVRGFGSNRKLVWVGWLVGCLLYLPRSRSTEKRELKGAYILLLMIKKKPPARTFNKRAISASPHRKGCYVHGRQNRTKSSKDPVMVPCVKS